MIVGTWPAVHGKLAKYGSMRVTTKPLWNFGRLPALISFSYPVKPTPNIKVNWLVTDTQPICQRRLPMSVNGWVFCLMRTRLRREWTKRVKF